MLPTDYMAEALALAGQGRGLTSPNPAVGAVIVRDGEVVGRGFHTYAGVKHAEIVALEQAGDTRGGRHSLRHAGAVLDQGRTGPCADALIAAGVARVVAAMDDPNPQVAGQGFARLRDAGIKVEMAESASAAAARLNEAFVHFMRTGRPLVMLKAAVTLDGKIAAPDDNRGGSPARRPAPMSRACATTPTQFSPVSARCWPTIACLPTAAISSAAARCCGWCSIRSCGCRSIRRW